jgi:hypothetical protein
MASRTAVHWWHWVRGKPPPQQVARKWLYAGARARRAAGCAPPRRRAALTP